MNPLSVRLLNWGVFRGEHTIPLPDGLVGILGELRNSPSSIDSNGSGKSSFVNAVPACLFGPSGRSFANDLTRGEDRMEIELTFEQGDDVYRVRRTFTVKGRAKLDLERAVPFIGEDGAGRFHDSWEPLTRESIEATQALINSTIGMSRKTFLDSVFLSQEDGSFADGKASETKQLLTEAAFGLEPPRWPVYAEMASSERKVYEAEVHQIDGRTQPLRDLVATKPELEREHEEALESETVAADTVADLEREREAIATRWQEAREQAARQGDLAGERRTAEAELREASSAYNALAAKATDAENAAKEKAIASEQLASLANGDEVPALEQRISALETAATEYERASAVHVTAYQQAQTATLQRVTLEQRAREADALALAARAKVVKLDSEHDATCDRCAQALPDAARAHARGSLLEEAETHDRASSRLHAEAEAIAVTEVPPAPEGDGPHEELRGLRGRLSKLHETVALRERLGERIRQSETAAASGPAPDVLAAAYQAVREKEAALAAIGEPLDLSGIEQEGRLAGDRLTAAKAALDAARSLRARLDERRVQMAAAEQALAEAATRTAELHRAIDTRVRLEKACGLNGVPALILETAVIPYIETETARVLADLGTPFQVELRTQREKKDGALADTLEVVIVTDTGESPYRKLSGGEKMRVSIALRVALGRLLAGRSGSRSRLFVIDEPRWLDQAGIEALIESLRGLLGEFSRIYVVTQSGTALRDSFDQVLCVVKDGGVSRVEDGYAVEAEAVAA